MLKILPVEFETCVNHSKAFLNLRRKENDFPLKIIISDKAYVWIGKINASAALKTV